MGTFKSVSTLRADGTGNEEHDSQNQMTEDSAHILHAQLFWTPAQLTHVEDTGSVHTHRSGEVSVTRRESRATQEHGYRFLTCNGLKAARTAERSRNHP